MKVIPKVSLSILLMSSFLPGKAQIKNAKTERVKVYGNCEMCKRSIEEAGNVKKVARVDWNKDSKEATITYDSLKTNQDEILKRIALAGYDGDKFLAPDDVYKGLAGCCQYVRLNKAEGTTIKGTDDQPLQQQGSVTEMKQALNQLKAVFEKYFAIKDALVNSDAKLASTLSKELLESIHAVEMDKLSAREHSVWMHVLENLKSNTGKIAATASIEKQRMAFMDLSVNLYDLLKVSKQQYTVYYQNCPMYNDGKGANWLSKESMIKNPYYGVKMLSCGKPIETIK